jgi:S1-C subfamily serine protease
MSRFTVPALVALGLTFAYGAGQEKAARPGDAPTRVSVGLAVEEMPDDGPHGGLIVRQVTPDGPAAKAGIEKGDVIVRVSNRQVDDYDELLGVLAGSDPGDQLTFTVVRDREPKRLKVTLGKVAGAGGKQAKGEGGRSCPYLGVLVVPPSELSEETADRLGLEDERGVVVVDVVPGSPAAKAGLRHGDVICGIDGQELREPGALRDRVRQGEAGKEVKLKVKRGEREREVRATLAEGPCDVLLVVPKGRSHDGDGAARVIEQLQRRVDHLEKRLKELEGKRGKKGGK